MKTLFFITCLVINLGCTQIKPLPEAVTNNAVALVTKHHRFEIYSFNGLSNGKTWQNINKQGFVYKYKKWSALQMPTSSQPVLASTAVSIRHKVYLLGGYTVAADHSEKSMPEIFEYDTRAEQWSIATTMPIPVDDTVALVYQNRYIYLISGWHDDDNISGVQIYDTKENQWHKATNFPAAAVFGHAGGIVENKMVICDGVKVVVNETSQKYAASPVCMLGVINKGDITQIQWSQIPHHSGTAYYRMAAVGQKSQNRVVFAGGSDNPYNFNGIGYNNIPSAASDKVFTFNFDTQTWKHYNQLIPKTMDHRALLNYRDKFFIVGGMLSEQQISNKIIEFSIPQVTTDTRRHYR